MDAKVLIALLGVGLLVTCAGCGKSAAEVSAGQAVSAATVTAAATAAAKAPAGGPDDAADKADAAKADTAGQPDKSDAGDDAHPHPLELPAEQLTRLGVATTPVQEAHYAPASEGFGVVVGHELVAQAAADLQTAVASEHLSGATLERAKRLSSGPGALGADVLETAQRQQAADQSAVLLARRKLSALLGVGFPWRGEAADAELAKLADGSHQLLRVTFPPVSSAPVVHKVLRISSIDAPSPTAWVARTVWSAPQDPALPGRSVFAVLTDANLAEGARVRAVSSSESATLGVVVPEAAVVITNGEYWCYVKKKEGVFQRVALDGGRPLGDGYFVADGVTVGNEVVTTGAGMLLARELNASTGAED